MMAGVSEPALSDEADPLYRPLGGLEAWAAAPVDEGAWEEAVGRLEALRRTDPDRGDMVAQGALLAAAYQSGALDGLYPPDDGLVRSLLRGEASLADAGDAERPHALAIHAALRLARDEDVSEATILRIHEVACRPQLTHRVLVEDRVQDHVLAGGEYKHHPNHVPLPGGGWLATAPVASVRPEMARLLGAVGDPAFLPLHPVVRGAYLHHGVLHVQPFADGNGRVARALASGALLRAASVPLLVLDRVAYERARSPADVVNVVQEGVAGLAELMGGSTADPAALDRWRRQARVATDLRAALVPGIEQALQRYGRGKERGWHADLSGATVVSEETIVVRVPLEGGGMVQEVVRIDAHPVDGGPVTAMAGEAQLRLRPGDDLEPWLDRVISVLALRVAAELEESPTAGS
jgi:Fic family protein